MTPHEIHQLIDRHHNLGTITTREREALHLRFVEGLSTRQIATALDIDRTTIRDRVKTALTKIARKDNPA